MSLGIAERRRVGRKKNPVPNDYVNAKIPRDIHRLASVIVALTKDKPKPDLGQVIGEACREALAKKADELYKASKLDRQ
jgi:hypothetical protein